MVHGTGGVHQRTNILGEGPSSHRQAANLHIGEVGRTVEGTPGIATDGALRHHDPHHRLNDMADTMAMTVGSEVQGPL